MEELAALITGVFDEATCEVCHYGLKVHNHLILTERNPNVATVLFGTLAEGREEEFLADVQRRLTAGLARDWEVRAAGWMEEMKMVAADLVKRKLKPITLAHRAQLDSGAAGAPSAELDGIDGGSLQCRTSGARHPGSRSR